MQSARPLGLTILVAVLLFGSEFGLLSGCDPAATEDPADAAAPDMGVDVAVGVDISDVPAAPQDATTTPGPDGVGDTGPGPQAPYVYSTTCKLPADPTVPGSLTLEPAFPNLSFGFPEDLEHAGDGSNRLFVVEQGGRVAVFPNDPAVTQGQVKTFLQMPPGKVNSGGEKGLLGLAFHPDYATNGHLFVNYTTGDLQTVIARFTVSANDPDHVDPGTELVLVIIDQPWDNHNGGDLSFGPDGYLYIAVGDGGWGGDPLDSGQDVTTLLGAMLRIDVDNAAPPLAYGIPPDNPFAVGGPAGAKREIWAWGLRNPWKFSFDRLTGRLFAGDVGQGEIEEIDILEGGRNYGWRRMEGSACFDNGCDPEAYALPIAEYHHPLGESVTGGYVYRGSALPSLYGAYVYADFETRALWTFRYGEEPPPDAPAMYAPDNPSSFGEDEAGELYVLGYTSGKVTRFALTGGQPTPQAFPQTLADTGCFSSVPDHQLGPGVLPYSVNSPLWSDGAVKQRYVVLPEGGKMTATPEGAWVFPTGTLFIKTFALDTTPGAPGGEVRLETRFLVYEGPDAMRGYSYRWNDAGTEAHLLTGAATRDLTVTPSGEAASSQTWEFPSRQQCLSCHTGPAGRVLGLETAQLNRAGTFGGVSMNQLDAFAAYDLYTAPLGAAPDALPRLAHPTGVDGSPADRARSYLHANCASCHREGGATGLPFDLRYTTALADAGICGEGAVKGGFDVMGLQLVAPGEPARSAVYLRLGPGAAAMPPIATSLPNAAARTVVSDWILGLTGCP